MDVQAFKVRYPQVQASDAAIQDALDEASIIVTTAWGGHQEQGVGLYAAHALTMESKAGSTGQAAATINRKKVGDVEVQYATKSDDQAAWFDLTHYGQRYWTLYQTIRSRTLGAFVT